MIALKQTLSDTHLCMVSHCDFVFVVWNILISLEGQSSNDLKRESTEDGSDQACCMVQGNASLEVILESNLDDCSSISNDDASMTSEDAHMLNDELALFYEDLLRKYKLLKNKSLQLKKKNDSLSSKLDCVLKEKKKFQKRRILF